MNFDFQFLLVEQQDSTVIFTINRPDKLNALNFKLIQELTQAFQYLRSDPLQTACDAEGTAVRVAILTGAGERAFVAGGDIAEMRTMSAIEAYAFSQAGHSLCSQIEACPFPVIAAVNGFALGGGCELMLACDLTYAAEEAMLGLPEVSLGVIPGFGGTQRLARHVGLAKARELIYTANRITAKEAKQIGLINDMFPRSQLHTRVHQIAETIASKGPLAIAAAKRVMLRGHGIDLTTANELEAQAFGLLFGSDDKTEGMNAFLEKRPPLFRAR